MNTTPEQDSMILHASGLSQGDKQFRKHYCDSATHPDLLALVKEGLMTGPHRSGFLAGDMAYFYLTDAGIRHAWGLYGWNKAQREGK